MLAAVDRDARRRHSVPSWLTAGPGRAPRAAMSTLRGTNVWRAPGAHCHKSIMTTEVLRRPTALGAHRARQVHYCHRTLAPSPCLRKLPRPRGPLTQQMSSVARRPPRPPGITPSGSVASPHGLRKRRGRRVHCRSRCLASSPGAPRAPPESLSTSTSVSQVIPGGRGGRRRAPRSNDQRGGLGQKRRIE